MDVKTCGFLSHIPTRFKFGWDEEDPLCLGLKQVILQQIQRLRQNGIQQLLHRARFRSRSLDR